MNRTFGAGADVKAAYDNLNKVLVETAFAIPTNTYDAGLIVAAKNVGGLHARHRQHAGRAHDRVQA